MKNCVLQNLALTVLFAGAMQAATITWDFSTGLVGNTPGNTETFSSGGFSIVAKGYSSNNNLTNLYGKAAGGNENGLGLNAFSDHEITAGEELHDFIQLDLGNLVGFTNFKIAFNSTTDEGWQVFNCGTSGTACGTSVLIGNDQGTLHSFSVGNVSSTGRYLDVKATSGNVLLYKLTADTAVPEPSTVSFMLLSGILLCGVSFLKAKRA